MPFTDTEVENVINRLVRSSIRRPYDTLGVRRTDVTFNDIQESAAGVFLLFQRTPFFFAGMGSSRLKDLALQADAKCSELLTALGVLRRRVLPVRDVSSLANARAALGELEAAVNRSGPPKDVTKVPAFVRFNANIDRFLGAVGSNIRHGGDIVPTPNEARSKIPALVVELEALMTTLVQKTALVAGAMEDYGKLNLAQLVSGGVISRARQVLGDRVDQLEAMNETERLEVLRETILEVLGTRAVVKRFGSFTPPSSIANLSGVGRPFSDSTRPALRAALEVANEGPYVLVAGTDEASSSNVLRLYKDAAPSWPSAPTTSFFLPQSAFAKIEGTQPGPFNIVAGQNDALVVKVNGVSTPVALTAGSRSASDVAADITTALAATNFKAEAYFFPLMYEGEVVCTGNDLSLAFGAFPPGSVSPGDEVDFTFGADAPSTRTVTAVSSSAITVDGAVLVGPTARVRYGAATRRVRIVPVDKTLSVQNKETLTLETPTTVQTQTGITLGMYGALLGRSVPTDAAVVANYVNANSQAFAAEVVFVPTLQDLSFRTVPSDPTGFVAYAWRGQATWGSGTAGVPVVLSSPPIASLVGQTVCLRDGAQPDATGLVTAQTGQTLTVTFGSAVTGASGLAEVGPTTGIAPDQRLDITSGPNAGSYYIASMGAVPFQGKLRKMPPQYRDGFAQPLLMEGLLGSESLRFFSTTTSLSSEIELYDPSLVFFPLAGPHSATATTKYFKLPSKPNDLEAGDFLEFFDTDHEVPSRERVITQVFADGVVELDEPIPAIGTYTFGSTTLPFARLRTDKVVSFGEYKAALEDWLAREEAQVRPFFLDLNRFIQPLLANQNPTDTDVGSAENKIDELRAALSEAGATSAGAQEPSLEFVIGTYESPYVAEADALLRAFREKGADRAVDMLLDCRFTTFFGLTQEETSYAGAFQKAARDVAVNDLPVRRVERLESTRSQLIASIESPDYENGTPDLDTTPDIDPPVDVG